MTQKVILILLDAFRFDYLSKADTPFLSRIAESSIYCKQLEPSFGFCERTEILVGKDSLESGFFTALGYDPEGSPYARIKPVLFVLNLFEKATRSLFLKKALRKVLWELVKNKAKTFHPRNIPMNMLSKISLTEDGLWSEIESNPNSLLNLFAGRVFFKAFTSLDRNDIDDDKGRMQKVIDGLCGSDVFFPVYLSQIDAVGHSFGPESAELRVAVKELDRQLEQFCDDILAKDSDANIYFCGDHGMTTVHTEIDIEAKIKEAFKLGVFPKQCHYFLDSTMARFWFPKANVQHEAIETFFEEQFSPGQGKLIFYRDYEKNGIPKSRRYGDCIWVCEPGCILNPDFFGGVTKIKGMHGYNGEFKDMHGFYIAYNTQDNPCTIPQAKLKSLYSKISRHAGQLS